MSPDTKGRETARDGRPVSSPAVVIVYATHCPNVGLARRRVRSALASMGLPLRWEEWNADSADTPKFARGRGSPTVLVNGRDVGGREEAEPLEAVDARGGEEAGEDAGARKDTPAADRCRLYGAGQGGLDRAPSVEAIREALVAARRGPGAAMPGAGRRPEDLEGVEETDLAAGRIVGRADERRKR